jgi:RNA polymerase sigma-70 factor (ECF subfamily)
MDKGDLEISELVARAQAGDADSVGQLFERLSDRIYRFFALRTADSETAEDLTQTVFLEMIQALPRYKVQRDAKFTTWLFQIARFRLIDHYRKQRPQVALDDAPEPSHEPLADYDPIASARLDRAMRRLPEKYQTVLHLRFREGLPAGEVAQIIRTTAINVRVIQYRALRALRAALSKQLQP